MMKNIVFLWIFVGFLLVSLTSVNAEARYDDSVNVNDGDALEIIVGGHRIVKEGDFNILGSLAFDETWMFYGSKLVKDNHERVYHGYLIEVGLEGEILFEFISDDPLQQEITHVIDFNGTALAVMSQESEMHQDSKKSTKFMWFKDGEVNHETSVEMHGFRAYTIIDDMIYLARYNNGHYDLTIDKHHTVNKELLRGLAEDKTYDGEVTFTTLSPLYVDGYRYGVGTHVISYPGYYTLETPRFSTTFSVNPVLKNIEHGRVYDEDITPMISGGQIFVNDQIFPVGGTIKDPGHYRIDVFGRNGMKKTVDITRSHDLQGVIDGEIYDDPVTVHFTGDAYLNGQPLMNGRVIDQNGRHTLTISGENGYESTVVFELNQDSNQGFSKHLGLGIGIITSAVFIAGVSMLAIFKKWK